MIVVIDPGIRGCGGAVYDGNTNKLVAASYIKSRCDSDNIAFAATEMANAVGAWASKIIVHGLVLEWPRIYATRIKEGKTKTDPNDLLGLAAVDAAIVMRLKPIISVTSYCPSDWKGQEKKEVTQRRILHRLDEREKQIMITVDEVYGAKAHNAYDAVGIGLHHLGRFKRKRVIE